MSKINKIEPVDTGRNIARAKKIERGLKELKIKIMGNSLREFPRRLRFAPLVSRGPFYDSPGD